MSIDLSAYPSLKRLVDAQLAVWPEHQNQLEKSLHRDGEALRDADESAAAVLKIAADAGSDERGFCADYRYVCEELLLPEEWFFRRHGRYRLASFSDALRDYYSNAPLMRRYLRGLLVSSVLWSNHAGVISFFRGRFLPRNAPGYAHLEVGPGHGLLLYFAAMDPRCASATGWDVSAESVSETRRALGALGAANRVTLETQDLLSAPDKPARYDSVVISEVLEHLEQPVQALESLKAHMRPGARIFVNIPANSPAPDHIYLLQDPAEALALVEQAGLEVVEHAFYPMTGYTLDQCRRQKLSVSCVVVGRRAP